MNKDWHKHNGLFFFDIACCELHSIFLGDTPDSYSAEMLSLPESAAKLQFICCKDLVIQRK